MSSRRKQGKKNPSPLLHRNNTDFLEKLEFDGEAPSNSNFVWFMQKAFYHQSRVLPALFSFRLTSGKESPIMKRKR